MTGTDDRLLRGYYLATPLFAVLDLGLHLPVRAVGIESPPLRLAYYAATFGIGFLMGARPAVAPWLAMGESAVNLTLLMAAVLIPIWTVTETMDPLAAADLPARVVNLALTGSMLVYSFYRAQHRLGSRRP